MKSLILLNDPPYGTERCYNGLRLASALAKASPDAEVTVFLMADAVLCAKQGQKTPDGYYNLERMIGVVLRTGGAGSGKGHVLLCGSCLSARGITDAELIDGTKRSTMDELAAATLAADRVLVF